MTLTDFLLARIADDETDALALDKELGRWHRERAAGTRGGSQGDILTTLIMPGTAYHPDRVLAECEAKRRIAALHDGGKDKSRGHWVNKTGCTCGDMPPCRTLAALALPYADHPDYREEWRP